MPLLVLAGIGLLFLIILQWPVVLPEALRQWLCRHVFTKHVWDEASIIWPRCVFCRCSWAEWKEQERARHGWNTLRIPPAGSRLTVDGVTYIRHTNNLYHDWRTYDADGRDCGYSDRFGRVLTALWYARVHGEHHG